EGSGNAPTLSNTTSDSRAAAGCTDNDNNSADFTAGTVAPRNSASPITSCGGGGTGGTGGAAGTGGAGGAGAGGAGAGGTSGAPSLPSPTLTPIQLSELKFGAFGDIRPAQPDDTANFPDSIVSRIFHDMQANGVTLAVDAGDHCFQSSTSSGGTGHAQ